MSKDRTPLIWRAIFQQPHHPALNPMALRISAPVPVEVRRSKGKYKAFVPGTDSLLPITPQCQASIMMSQTEIYFKTKTQDWQALEFNIDTGETRPLTDQEVYTDAKGFSHIRRQKAPATGKES